MRKNETPILFVEYIRLDDVLCRVISIERDSQLIRIDGDLARFANIVRAKLRFATKILEVLDKTLNFFNPRFFVKKATDSLGSVAQKYDRPEEVELNQQLVGKGLEEWEKDVLAKYLRPKSRILDIGCGAGREAIALAKIGFEVTGIDISPKIIAKASENARKEGLNIEFKAQSASDIDFPANSFEYVLFSWGVYSYIPTKKLRIETLKKMKDVLKPDGLLFFSAYYQDKKLFSRVNIIGIFRRLRNFFFREKSDSEPGDLMLRYVSGVSHPRSLCFCHFFSGPKEILEETNSAGLTVLEGEGSGLWVAKP